MIEPRTYPKDDPANVKALMSDYRGILEARDRPTDLRVEALRAVLHRALAQLARYEELRRQAKLTPKSKPAPPPKASAPARRPQGGNRRAPARR